MVISALVVVAVSGLVAEHLRISLLTRTIEPALLVNRQVVRAMADAKSTVSEYATSPSPQVAQDYLRLDAEISAGLDQLGPLAERADLGPVADRQQAAVQRWRSEVAEPTLADPSRPPVAAVAEADYAAFRSANIDLNAELVVRSSDLARETLWVSAAVVSTVVLAGITGLVLILTRGRRAQAAISPPLEALHRVVTARAAGDYNVRADPDAGVVEVRAVAQAVNLLMRASALERQRLADDAALAAAIHRIGLSISHTLDMGEIMTTCADQLRHELHADVAWVRTFEGENDRPGRVLGTMRPPEITLVSPPHLQQIGIDLAPRLWATQRAAALAPGDVGVPDLLDAADSQALLDFVSEGAGVNALLLVALGAGSQCLGYFALGRADAGNPWTASEAQAAIDVGHYIGRAVLHERMFDGERLVVEELRALDFQKNEFVSTVSHELRTPLSAIIGHLELLDDEEVSGPARRYLRTIERNSRRLQMLIEDLLLLSRVEEREVRAEQRRVDLDAVIVRVLADQPTDGRGVRVRHHGDWDAVVLGDEDELSRVVINLVGNAVKFSPSGSEVDVTLSRTADTAVLRVVDHGIGIDPADQPHVFTRFYRSRRLEANSVPGTGLGLAICKIIIDKHDGSIELDSVLGEGTTFTVTLPLADARTGRSAETAGRAAG